eukprot:CAMPEP_0181322246 /NCGR_PEP_ID=MMETSP1101-20121128/19126_1 /TAXON_ID=46948 /ORGANISM="Rhodomonas abbreviata, Strain Caron Lab Isolate" /LENGTH=89 /DNA_ID=CAMNT_0023430147 /DNA_START=479 /DNA_END=745 /DNA_ORIENTATION=+
MKLIYNGGMQRGCTYATIFSRSRDRVDEMVRRSSTLTLVDLQLILACLALLSKSDTPTIISMCGNMVLYVICGLIGALTVAPYKYMWWV